MIFTSAATCRFVVSLLSCLMIASGPAGASEVGWRPYEVALSATDPDQIAVALYYPTQVPARDIAMGPYTVHVAPMAPPPDKVKGLVIVSHGTGGSELSLHGLAEALARNGYLAASLRHPGDNYLDKSVWQKPPGTIFVARPRQVSRVIDALLADAAWRGRIAADGKGPMIGAVGHSAGGFTVVGLAGGKVDLSLIGAHCASDHAADPIFCGMGSDPAQPSREFASTADPRVRAIVAMAPVGVMFTALSLQAITVPTLVYAAENDRWLPPRFHAARIAQNVPGAQFEIVADAWHFAFMDKVGIRIPTLDGDANADPPGFDRAAVLTRLDAEVPAFFDRAFAPMP